MRDLIAALLALAGIVGVGGGPFLSDAFVALQKETIRKLSQPQLSLEAFTKKLTGRSK